MNKPPARRLHELSVPEAEGAFARSRTRSRVERLKSSVNPTAAASFDAFVSDLETNVSGLVQERKAQSRKLRKREIYLFWLTITAAACAPLLVCVGLSLLLIDVTVS